MSQESPVLRKTDGGHVHWCPACQRIHTIPDGWQFDGDYDQPTFWPSISIKYNGPDADQPEPNGAMWAAHCHYNVAEGQIRFCPDSSHALAGQNVPMPDLPAHLQD